MADYAPRERVEWTDDRVTMRGTVREPVERFAAPGLWYRVDGDDGSLYIVASTSLRREGDPASEVQELMAERFGR